MAYFGVEIFVETQNVFCSVNLTPEQSEHHYNKKILKIIY